MSDFAYNFNITSDEQFSGLSGLFGYMIRKVAPNAGMTTSYNGRLLFEPLQIGVIGGPGSGKSTFIKNGVDKNSGDTDFEMSERTVDSYDCKRIVKVWRRWVHADFEIRMQDERAIASCPSIYVNDLPDFDRRGIRIFEHLSSEQKPYCGLLIHVYRPSGDLRYMSIELKQKFLMMPETQQFLRGAAEFRIDS